MAGDPWVIQPHEHGKFAEHFRNLNPVNGLVTGEQAKRFMLQSQLPPPILGQIWVLSDTNADGKLDLKEFSIACKIINLKLHGIEIPKVLPPSLLASLSPTDGAPKPLYSQPQKPAIPPLPNLSQTSASSPLIPGVQPIIANTSNQSLIGDLVSSQSLISGIQPMIPSNSMSLPRKPSLTSNNQTLISGLATSQPLIPNQPLMANTVSQPMFSQPPLIPPMSVGSQPISSVSSNLVGGFDPMIAGGTSQQFMSGSQPLMAGSQPLLSGTQSLMTGSQPPMGISQPLIGTSQPLMAGSQPLIGSSQPLMGGSQPMMAQSSVSQSIMNGPQNLINTSQPLILGSGGFASSQPLIQSPPSIMGNIGNTSSASTMVSSGLPVTSTPIATSGQSKMQTMDDILNPGIQSPSQDVPLGTMTPTAPEWGLPQAQRLKYGQLFNTTDHTKAGWVSGAQARSIMLQSRLPQATLAQIWALADIDRDGKLGCEEFVLAMYLCEIATKGETIPLKLPPDMIPPAFRRESIGSGGSQSSLEERRRENFVRGQAELERRRAALANAQTKEKAERERKEREEAEKREKIRLEILKKEQEEIQRKQKEEQEKRDAARKEMERQCQLEWEMKRTRELEAMRSEEQSKVLALKAKSQHLTGELALVNTRAANLAKDIRDTRTNVAQVKSTIDGMRSSRDSSMQEMSQLKTKVKELNAKQITLNQEKAQLDAKAKASEGAGEDGKLNMLEVTLKQLREKVETAKAIVEAKRLDVETNDQQLASLTSTVSELSEKCQKVWQLYEEKRQQYEEMRTTAPAEAAWDSSANWDSAAGAAAPEADWASSAADAAWTQPQPDTQESVSAPPVDSSGSLSLSPRRFRCVYEFSSRSKDELPLQPGDVVTDAPPPRADADEGWRWGQCRGQLGWYPESYVEEMAPGVQTALILDPVDSKTPLEGIAEVPETLNDAVAAEVLPGAATSPPASARLESDRYVAAYSYNSTEPGDLTFEAGEVIHVVGKDGDWWTGKIGSDRTGIFPSNYVQKTENVTAPLDAATKVTQPDVLPQSIPEKVVEPATIEMSPLAPQQKLADLADLTPPNESPRYPTQVPLVVHEDVNFLTDRYQNDEPKSTTPISSEVASITESAEIREKFGSNGSGGRPQSVTRRDSGRDSTGLPRKKMEVAQALAAFTANSAEQLSLQKGQLVLVRKKADSGWWEGELQAKGRNKQVGWFPASYVKLLQSSGRTSGRTTPVMSSKVDNFPQEQVIDKVIALYPYTAQNADELSFEKDDIIAVTNRDQDPAWWQGELRGMTGLFPSNYVTKLIHDN